MMGWSYFRSGPDRWWRLFGYQLGLHMDGRRRTFSERNGRSKPTPTIRVGRLAEISFCKLRSAGRKT
jgi:hypothetical protein